MHESTSNINIQKFSLFSTRRAWTFRVLLEAAHWGVSGLSWKILRIFSIQKVFAFQFSLHHSLSWDRPWRLSSVRRKIIHYRIIPLRKIRCQAIWLFLLVYICCERRKREWNCFHNSVKAGKMRREINRREIGAKNIKTHRLPSWKWKYVDITRVSCSRDICLVNFPHSFCPFSVQHISHIFLPLKSVLSLDPSFSVRTMEWKL